MTRWKARRRSQGRGDGGAVRARAAEDEPGRRPDRLGAMLALGFIVLLLSTELVLTLPDETDSATLVATFYATHRAIIVVLQTLGFVAAGLLGGYAWRLRSVDRVVAGTGLATAVCAVVPGLVTLVIAVVADSAESASAGRWNRLEPRADDVLFVGILLFGLAVLLRLGRRLPLLGVLAGVVALSCLARLILEAMGRRRGALESVGPLSFVVLVATMAVLSWRGAFRSGVVSLRAAPR
jgi:hypothetical protein